ncbi:MAG: hypothetical protein AABW54_04470 [Candidatus Micrarchaeota archaeon]
MTERIEIGAPELPEAYHNLVKKTRFDGEALKALREKRDLLGDERTEEVLDMLKASIAKVHEHMEPGPHSEQDWSGIHPEYHLRREATFKNLAKNPALVGAKAARDRITKALSGMSAGNPLRGRLETELGWQTDEIARVEVKQTALDKHLWAQFCYFYNCPVTPGEEPATGQRHTPTWQEMNVGNSDVALAFIMATEHRAPLVHHLSRVMHLHNSLAPLLGVRPIHSLRGLSLQQLLQSTAMLHAARERLLKGLLPAEVEEHDEGRRTWPKRAHEAERDGDFARRPETPRRPGASNTAERLARLRRSGL